jgi:exoribonuclease II
MTHFESYAELNERLLRCILTGRSETKDANEIRKQMDEHWKQMSSIEQDLMRKKCEGRA